MNRMKPDVNEIISRLRSMGKKPRPYRDGWLALCPAHNDSHPSLSISSKRNGDGEGALLHCFAGRRYEDIMRALGFNNRDMIVPRPRGINRVSGNNGLPFLPKSGLLCFPT
jgi:hypothetical protein